MQGNNLILRYERYEALKYIPYVKRNFFLVLSLVVHILTTGLDRVNCQKLKKTTALVILLDSFFVRNLQTLIRLALRPKQHCI